MKTFFLCCIVLIFGLCASAQLKRYQLALVGFYNLENLYDTIDNPMINDDDFTPKGLKQYGTTIFKDKLNKLAGVIADIGKSYTEDGLAIFGVAEIENDTVLQFLVQHPLIKKRNYHIVHASSKDVRGVDVGLLYNPAYFTPLDAQKLFVSLPGNSKDAYYTRDILYCKGLLQNDTVHIYVNHWPSRRGGQKRSAPARMAAAAVCRKHIDSIQKKNAVAKLIVMGDMNDDPIDKSICVGLKAKGKKDALNPGELYNPWVSWFNNGIGTLAHRDRWGLFDQIILSQSLLGKQEEGFHFYREHIYNPAYLKEFTGKYKGYPMRTWDGNRYRGGYSDHFPTYVVLLKGIMD
ncbi:MAG: endonuclease/exonuclease/phosphatase [Sediminibacterium sp.]